MKTPARRFYRQFAVLAALTPLAAGCAHKPLPRPPRPVPTAGPSVAPPTFSPGVNAPDLTTGVTGRSPFAANRPAIFEAVWTTIRDKHFDPALGGVDWDKAKKDFYPKALGAPDEPTFYRTLNEMLSLLGHSHMFVTGPGDAHGSARSDATADPDAEMGQTGLTIRSVEGQPTIVAVVPGSTAALAGLKPGFVVQSIAGQPPRAATQSRALRPAEERFFMARNAHDRLQGPVGSKVSVVFKDKHDTERRITLTRTRSERPTSGFGHLRDMPLSFEARQAGDVGIVSFNIFLMQPVLKQVTDAIDRFREAGARALIIDLRDNPGGMAAMAIPIAARLYGTNFSLGTMRFRDHTNHLAGQGALDVKPFLGPVVVIVNEGSASTAEIFAAGLQESGRAKVVGSVTLGKALPSAIENLPGGALLQYVVADFSTPKGKTIEGRGVIPDKNVVETRQAYLEGRDVAMQSALDLARRLVHQSATTVDETLDRFEKASGGRAPWRNIHSIKSRMHMTMANLGVQADGTSLRTSDGRWREDMTIPGVGATTVACDGKRIWSQDPIHGLRWLSGGEEIQTRLAGHWMAPFRARELYTHIELVPGDRKDTAGANATCLRFEHPEVPPEIACFDQESHLLVSTKTKKISPQGTTPVETTFEDYRTVHDAVTPFKQTINMGPVTLEVSIEEISFNVPVTDNKIFQLPTPDNVP